MSVDQFQDELAAIVGRAESSDLDPSVDWLFVRANTKHAEYKSAVQSAIYAARESGQLLLEAKAQYQRVYGKRADWTGVLRREFEGSLQTAYNHMQIANSENWEKIEAYLQQLELSQKDQDFGVRHALKLLSAGEAEVVEGEIVDESLIPTVGNKEGKSRVSDTAVRDGADGAEEPEEKCGRLSNPNSHDEHYTPIHIIAAVVGVLGKIDLDPCSNDGKNPCVPAERHYTKAENGLLNPWEGRVYANPPYSDLLPWAKKLNQELTDVDEALILLPAYTDTQWWDEFCQNSPMICFLHGRLTFRGNETPARFPSAMLYFGQEWGRFYEQFVGLGRIFQEIDREAFGD